MTVAAVSRSRRSFLLVLAAFILPVVLAKLALEQHWFNYGVTNQGQLFEQPLALADVGLSEQDFHHKWVIFVPVTGNCDQLCVKTLAGIQNTYTALGQEMPRVSLVGLMPSDDQQLTLDKNKWLLQAMPVQAQSKLSAGKVFVVDPLGNFVMSYDKPTGEQQVIAFGKAMLADMKKLLKYSKVG